MQTPSPDLASAVLIPLGQWHLAALGQRPELTDLGIAFKPTHDALVAKAAARSAADAAVVLPRVILRFAELRLERTLRGIAAAATAIDGKKGGPVFTAIFRDGVDAVVRPRGDAQRAAAEGVVTRLTTLSIAVPVRESHLAELTADTESFASALQARKVAVTAAGVAFAEEVAAREDFCRGYDSNAGAVRQRFPRDREQQDLFFDELRSRPRRARSDEEDDEDRPTPTPTT